MGSGSPSTACEKLGALGIGREHRVDQALRTRRGFLRHRADAPAPAQLDFAGFAFIFAEDQLQQRGLARPVAADQADLAPVRDRGAGAIQDQTAGNANGDIVDDEHGWEGISGKRKRNPP